MRIITARRSPSSFLPRVSALLSAIIISLLFSTAFVSLAVLKEAQAGKGGGGGGGGFMDYTICLNEGVMNKTREKASIDPVKEMEGKKRLR